MCGHVEARGGDRSGDVSEFVFGGTAEPAMVPTATGATTTAATAEAATTAPASSSFELAGSSSDGVAASFRRGFVVHIQLLVSIRCSICIPILILRESHRESLAR